MTKKSRKRNHKPRQRTGPAKSPKIQANPSLAPGTVVQESRGESIAKSHISLRQLATRASLLLALPFAFLPQDSRPDNSAVNTPITTDEVDTTVQGEDAFFSKLASYPLYEQVKRIDAYYSIHRLNLNTLVNKVLPVWAKSYIQASGSSLDAETLIRNTSLFNKYNRPPQWNDSEVGRVDINFPNREKSKVQLDFSVFTSNALTPHPYIPQNAAYGIVYIRSGLWHEFAHYDTTFNADSGLSTIINGHSLFHPPIRSVESTVVNAFNFATIHPNQSSTVYWGEFDEMATDVVMSYHANAAKVTSVLAYPNAVVLRRFLDWIGFPKDKFVQYHQTSNLRALIRDLGELSLQHRARLLPSSSEEDLIVEGVKIIRILNRLSEKNVNHIESLFPGFQNTIFSTPIQMIQ